MSLVEMRGQVIGAEAVIQKLGVTAPVNAIQRSRDAVHALGLLLEAKVKTEKLSGGVLNRRTGRLFRSINTRFADEATTSTASVGSSLKYARIWELTGSREFTILPSKKQALFWPGAAHPVKSVVHPAQAPRPFLRPALNEMRTTIHETLARTLSGITH